MNNYNVVLRHNIKVSLAVNFELNNTFNWTLHRNNSLRIIL